MKGEHGFALIAALWLIAAVSAIVGLGVSVARLGQQTTINRITLTRGRWAAEACLAIVQGRWRARGVADTATIDLGHSTRCHWQMDDLGARINVNTADREVLTRALGDSGAAFDLLATRRTSGGAFASLAQLSSEHRFLFTVHGPGSINLNAASDTVLMALPGITSEAVERIVTQRSLGRPITSLDELAGMLSPPARAALLERYANLARIVTFSPAQLLITAEGWVDGRAPRAMIDAVVVPLPERLAVIRRRVW